MADNAAETGNDAGFMEGGEAGEDFLLLPAQTQGDFGIGARRQRQSVLDFGKETAVVFIGFGPVRRAAGAAARIAAPSRGKPRSM